MPADAKITHVSHSPGTVLWVSILASAAVAALTTLLIEYLAKPSLETRKERILEHHRQFRSAVRGLDRVRFLGMQLSRSRNDQETDYYRLRTQRFADEIEANMEMAHEIIEEVPVAVQNDWYECVAAATSISKRIQRGINPDDDPAWEELDAVITQLDCFCDLFNTPESRWIKRRRLFRLIKSSPLDTL